MEAFQTIKQALCSEPIVDYPRKDRPYSLIVDACTESDKNMGGREPSYVRQTKMEKKK